MHKVLLVDTNVSASPIYNYLLQSGHDVYVVGSNPNDYLAKTVSNYINMDYSDIEAMLELIERLKIDILIPGCNDRSYQVCAEINAKRVFFGIDCVEATETINNKEKFRKFSREIGLPVPKLFPQNNPISAGSIIIKPVDSFSGRGMTVLHEYNQDNLTGAIKLAESASRTGACIIEEYVTGNLYSHSAFISKQEILIDFIVEEHGTSNQFTVDTSRLVYGFNPSVLGKIRTAVAQIVQELRLADGLIHTQFLVNGDDYWLVEITRRCPGDLYSQLIELSTGSKYAEMYACSFLNQALDTSSAYTKIEWVIRHTVSQASESFLGSLAFNIPVKILKFIPLSVAGDLIKPSPFSRVGLLFTKSDSEEEQDFLFAKILSRDLYTIQGSKRE